MAAQKGIPYFKVTEIIHREYENFLNFFIQATVKKFIISCLIYFRTTSFFHVPCLYTCISISYGTL